MEYNVYMQKVDEYLSPIAGTKKNLESDFDGLIYFSMKGLNSIGRTKNVYKETYADSDKVRVYVPESIKNESNKVVLTLFFIGETRQDVYDSFNEYITSGRTVYWDDVRKKKLYFFIEDEIEPMEDVFKNGTPYIKVEYKLTNIYGKTTKSETL